MIIFLLGRGGEEQQVVIRGSKGLNHYHVHPQHGSTPQFDQHHIKLLTEVLTEQLKTPTSEYASQIQW